MIDAETNDRKILDTLSQSLDEWVCRGNEQPLTRWLKRELDSKGVPVRLTLPSWRECLRLIAAAHSTRSTWPSHWEESITRLIQTSLRFTRPDGSTATEFGRPNGDARTGDGSGESKRSGAFGRAGITSRKWLAQRKGEHPGAREAWSSADQVLAVLRSDGMATADFLAIDHRHANSACRFELFGAGRSWLGPTWTIDGQATAPTRPRPRAWASTSDVALAEWSTRTADLRLTRSAALLRARRLALLSVLVDKPTIAPRDIEFRLAFPSLLSAAPEKASRAIQLTESNKKGSAQILPIGLPCASYATDRGNFQMDQAELVLHQVAHGRRCWLPLLVSWDAARHRKDVNWRILTVSERSRIVSPDRAFAVRVSWGRHETYVIYRSLGPPAVRAFLGHQTRARFLIGLFTNDATVEPILEIN